MFSLFVIRTVNIFFSEFINLFHRSFVCELNKQLQHSKFRGVVLQVNLLFFPSRNSSIYGRSLYWFPPSPKFPIVSLHNSDTLFFSRTTPLKKVSMATLARRFLCINDFINQIIYRFLKKLRKGAKSINLETFFSRTTHLATLHVTTVPILLSYFY